MRVIAISGSLRAASINSALLRAAARLAPPDMEVVNGCTVGDLPFYNPDLEAAVPAVASTFRTAVAAADALLIASPEYAHGVTGTLKNALDWLVGLETFVAKPVAIFNASPSSCHADAALREILSTMSAVIVEDASIRIPLIGLQRTEDGMLESATVAGTIKGALAALARAVVRK